MGKYDLDKRSREGRAIIQAARDAGPWTREDEEAIAFLRNLSVRATLTDAEVRAMRILRQREINESIKRRNARG